ncbi:MAG: hypothetical protein QG608_591 [Actinomycetota bacterium]|nr:hypothetical protein [Actinomycetota bacterium]
MSRPMRLLLAAISVIAVGIGVGVLHQGPADAAHGQYGYYYFYGTAGQTLDSEGTRARLSIAAPRVGERGHHSLAQLSVSDSGSHRQVIEVGWMVDESLYGEAGPHFFVHRWVDGAYLENGEHCYNRCGFVPLADSTVRAGGSLTAGGSAVFTIRHFAQPAGWWIGYDGQWVGHYPDSLWNGTFTQGGRNQWFGEVSAESTTPGCTQMGTGVAASSSGAATITGITNFVGNASEAADISVSASDPEYYGVHRLGVDGMRYGGTGGCG